MQKILAFGFLLLLLSCSKADYPISGSFSDSPTPPVPDYSRIAFWAAHPNKLDAADSVPLKSNLKDEQQTASADVFFVHPTTFLRKPRNIFHWNADCNEKYSWVFPGKL